MGEDIVAGTVLRVRKPQNPQGPPPLTKKTNKLL